MCNVLLSAQVSGGTVAHFLYAGYSTTDPTGGSTTAAVPISGTWTNEPIDVNGTTINQNDEVPAGSGSLAAPQSFDLANEPNGYYMFVAQTAAGTVADCSDANFCGDCEVIVVEKISTPCAGSDATVTFCSNEGIANLYAQLGQCTGAVNADTNGEWTLTSGSPAGGSFVLTVDGDGTNDTFNPSTSGAGTYGFTYTVASGGTIENDPTCTDCTATAVVTITVTAQPNAGTASHITICAA